MKLKLSIIIALTLWASTFVGIRAAVVDYSPVDIAVFRFIISSIILIVICFFQKVSFPDVKNLLYFVLLGAVLFINYVSLNYGTKTITAGETTLLVSTSQLFQVFLAYLFLKEAISVRFLAGLFVCFSGILAITLQNSRGLSFNWGVLFVLIAAITNAVYFIVQKPLLKRHTPLEVVCYSTWIASIFLLPSGKNALMSFQTSSPGSSIAVIYIGIASVVANICWSWVLSKTEASKAAVFLYTIPVLTIVMGFIWLGEYPSLFSCAGGLLIIGGVIISNSQKTEQIQRPFQEQVRP